MLNLEADKNDTEVGDLLKPGHSWWSILATDYLFSCVVLLQVHVVRSGVRLG